MVTFTERELLVLICAFLSNKQIVMGDEESIRDMVGRYQHPPFTLVFPVCMRMTVQDTHRLNELLKQAHEYLSSTEVLPKHPVNMIERADAMMAAIKDDYDKNLKGNWKDGNQ